MKLNTISRYPHKALLSRVTYTLDPNTSLRVPSYIPTGIEVECKFITPSTGSAKVYSKTMLSTFDRLLTPVDAKGTPLFEDVTFLGFQVTTVAPIINNFGYIDGYAYGLLRLIAEVT